MIPSRVILPMLLGLSVIWLAALRTDPAAVAQIVPQETKAKRPMPAEEVATDIVTREAICRWASKPPVLDGKLDDPCWKEAVVIDRFATFWTRTKTPREGTRAFLVWDDVAIYYAGAMTDTEVRAFGTHRNDTLWEGDVFELFLKPSAKHPEYFEFQANPRSHVFEMAFARRGEH